MKLKQFNGLHSAIKKSKSNKYKDKDNKETSVVVNCYLKLDDQAEEKSYLQKMHNKIINMPVEESSKSLHKFGHLGYLTEEIDDGVGEIYAIKYLFSEAWSEEGEQNINKKEGYCKISSDVLKTRLPKAIEIIMQRDKLDDKNKNKVTTRNRLRRQNNQQKEDYSSRVKSLKILCNCLSKRRKKVRILECMCLTNSGKNKGKIEKSFVSFLFDNRMERKLIYLPKN